MCTGDEQPKLNKAVAMPVDVQVRRSNIVEFKFYFYVLQGYIAVMIKDSAA
jgi:hypothetical protein